VIAALVSTKSATPTTADGGFRGSYRPKGHALVLFWGGACIKGTLCRL
jgi:hypothetical protein